MKKKISIAIIILFIILGITGMASAWSPTMQSPLFPQGNIFCRQKGGPVRFSHPEAPTYILHESKWYRKNHEPTMVERVTTANLLKMKVINSIPKYAKGVPIGGNFADYDEAHGTSFQIWNTPVYHVVSSVTRTNDTVAYSFSSRNSPLVGDSRVGNYAGNVSDSASDLTIQKALWADPTFNEGNSYPSNALYTEAVAYQRFHNRYVAPGYSNQVTFLQTDPKVIALRDEQAYILGPYCVTYPDESRFSFMNDIYFKDKDGNIIPTRPEIIRENATRPYPSSGEIFYLKIKAADISYMNYLDLNINFRYISETKATYKLLEGTGRIDEYLLEDGEDRRYGTDYCSSDECDGHEWFQVKLKSWALLIQGVGEYNAQKLVELVSKSRTWTNYEISSSTQLAYNDPDNPENVDIPVTPGTPDIPSNTPEIPKIPDKPGKPIIPLTFKIKGTVFEDSVGGKETLADGVYTENSEDKKIANVIVSLYQIDNNGVETLFKVMRTDEQGNYAFYELNPMYTYYIKFTYNGQYYEPTTYKASLNGGGDGTNPYTTSWNVNSKATDRPNERVAFNEKFASIGSSPENYEESKKTFSKKILQGYELQSDGEYTLENEPTIDDYGNLINTDDAEKVQYVKDCYMDAYTGLNGTMDYYNIKDRMIIDDKNSRDPNVLKEVFEPTYDPNYHINLGLYKRPDVDLALRKDVYSATIEINGKSHTYEYDQRRGTDDSVNEIDGLQNLDTTWDIDIRLSDSYYDRWYSRELYRSDYDYKVSMYGDNYEEYGKVKGNGVNVPDDELNVYVTYKLTVRNQSMSVTASVDEIVDYFDSDYEYVDNRSYIEIKRGVGAGIRPVGASYDTQYSSNTVTRLTDYDNLYITGLKGTYLTGGQTAYIYLTFRVKKDNIENENWVRLDEEVLSAAEIGVGKENIAEINGYSTIYGRNTQVPNIGDVEGTVAGLVDRDSNPGNLDPDSVPKDGEIRYKEFEDDTDKAPNIRLKLYRDDRSNRIITGMVWEDERHDQVNVATIGDGIRQENETPINGVTVQLVELMAVENPNEPSGAEIKEYVWKEFGAPARTQVSQEIGEEYTVGKGTGSGTQRIEQPIVNISTLVEPHDLGENYNKGKYAFKSFMPGNYVVRFIYGDTTRTVLTNDVNAEVNQMVQQTGLNAKSYNGQDYKSTTYQEGVPQNREYVWKRKSSFNVGQETEGAEIRKITTYDRDVCNQNESGTYLYDITTSEAYNNSDSSHPYVSDAKDIYTNETIEEANNMKRTDSTLNTRTDVINYSNGDINNPQVGITNHIAEVLASHRDVQKYYGKNETQELINELMAKTKMTAETGIMNIEFEYDRDETLDNEHDNFQSYAIQNVDLGLEERPKAQISIEKEITNVKLTLADKTVLFDANGAGTNILWNKHKFYELDYKYKNMLDPDLYGSIRNIRDRNADKFGIVQISMDEELMHGATIQIEYKITVTNDGEVDYNDNKFYYTGAIDQANIGNAIVKTTTDQVIDYIANNLEFYENDNNRRDNNNIQRNWKIISPATLKNQDLVNTKLENPVKEYNTIVTTNNLAIPLVPKVYKEKMTTNEQDTVNTSLVLTQLISPENEQDDLSYRNILEVVKTSNTVGRRNEYSVVGNQNPQESPQELDSDTSEEVKILPPFGLTGITKQIYTYGLLVIATGIILIGGIIFIKRKI